MKFEFKCLQNKENGKDRKEEKEKRKKPITPSRPVSTGPNYLLQFSRSRQPRWPAGGPRVGRAGCGGERPGSGIIEL
jgi:hypothetical protein